MNKLTKALSSIKYKKTLAILALACIELIGFLAFNQNFYSIIVTPLFVIALMNLDGERGG